MTPFRFTRVFTGSFVASLFFVACSASNNGFPGDGAGGEGGSGVGTSGASSGGTAGKAGSSTNGGSSAATGGTGGTNGGSGTGGTGGTIDTGGSGGTGVPMNACASPCGPAELCDLDHLGFDDNCDGQVDETCPCQPGQTHSCFKGDPSFRDTASCKDGTERCTEVGTFGPCLGGKHATADENCQIALVDGCKDINAAPFSKVSLANGTSGFSNDADAGSESYAIECPAAVSPCPAVSGTGTSASFQPLQSGQYHVTYTKTVGGAAASCKYSVYVGAGGLRIELGWDSAGKEAPTATSTLKGPDLDLHVHRPGTTTPWGTSDDCNYTNCRADNYNPEGGAKPGASWFTDDPNAAPPRNWTKKPAYKDNLCYSAPKGTGGQWAVIDKGCHNPRLDLDNFGCEATTTDPGDPGFCAPENINFDEVPTGSWIRVGVEYHGTCAPTLATRPTVRIYCAGGQVAEIGSVGFDAPVTFTKADCENTFWLAADVFVTQNECSIQCVVQPVYADAAKTKPAFITIDESRKSFGPAYPPNP
jgi:hypothetical protein